MMAKTISAPEIIAKTIIAPFVLVAAAIPGGILFARLMYSVILIATKIVFWAGKKIFDYLQNDPRWSAN